MFEEPGVGYCEGFDDIAHLVILAVPLRFEHTVPKDGPKLTVTMILDGQTDLLVQHVLPEHFPHIIEITIRRLEIGSLIALGIFVVTAPFSYWFAVNKVSNLRVE